jgi:hypothetical protein
MANARSRSVPITAAPPASPRREYWRALVEECGRSGVSQAEFCRRRGIPAGTLSFWKSTLAREAGQRPRLPASIAARSAFLPVRLAAPRPPSLDAERGGPTPWDGEIEIAMGDGRLVRVRGRVDAPWLGQVLGVLEAARC